MVLAEHAGRYSNDRVKFRELRGDLKSNKKKSGEHEFAPIMKPLRYSCGQNTRPVTSH